MYEGIECPTGGNKLQYHIQNVSTVVSTCLAQLLKQRYNLQIRDVPREVILPVTG